ncbi:radical SAM/SPASM domain-containing protein [Candidatus Allofournierella merdavium]|uniref:radical SAM protein n=1 Tax=Candidatus Allofournierella merdavium TaxID=2838593 RepID=UPI00374E802B
MIDLVTLREFLFREKYLRQVRHITLNPGGPGVVRLHMVPPATRLRRSVPYVVILNGRDVLPLNISWAILLACLMDALAPYADREVPDEALEGVAAKAVDAARRVYPGVKPARMRAELDRMLQSFIAIARGQQPPEEVAPISLGDYAPQMTAPHRMDLMISAMEKEGRWNCNQKCLHCYAAGQPEASLEELDTAGWKQVLEKLRAAGVPQVTFTGGEPTMRADLAELVDAARWFVTRLNSNGRLLTPALCKALYEASLDSVQITLYSADAAAHNELVGAPGFADTVAGIQNALAAGLSVSVNTPLCSRNADYAATLAFLHGLGVRYVTCSGLIPTGGALTEGSRATRLSPEELEALLKQAVEYCAANGMEIDFTSPGWLPPETLLGLGLPMAPTCGACLSNMAVAPDGTVVPCQSWLTDDGLGNILTDDWKAIWHSPRCAAIRAESARMDHICQLREKEGAQ